MSALPPELVATPDAMARLARALAPAKAIAIDTEGNSFHAYRDRVCLIQLAIARGQDLPAAVEDVQVFIVDPLAADPALLGELFADPAHLLVVHGGDFDVRSLRRDFGFSFGRMFDTMLAAQTMHLPELGLAALLKTELGIAIVKGEQRSDWGRRPLREQQLRYAAEDVRHLLPLAAKLSARLVERKLLDAAEAHFEKLRHLVARENPFDVQGFRRMKGSRPLDARQLRVLEALWLGRDRLSRELDRAPFKVIGEQAMLEVARRLPADLAALRQTPGVGDLVVRRLGKEVIEAGAAGAKDGGELPSG